MIVCCFHLIFFSSLFFYLISEEDFFEKFQQMQKKKEKLETKDKTSHRVYCPFFSDVKQECWWLYITDKKKNQIACTPVYICSLKQFEEVTRKNKQLKSHDIIEIAY